MNPLTRQLALAAAILLSAGAASAASVSVSYEHPDQFTDLPFTPWDREQVLKDLTEHFNALGKLLPADQQLKIDVLDVDLAGREHMSHRGAREIRILKDQADWPRMHLRYSLEANGQVLKSGDEQLSDMMYMGHINRYSDGDTLRYEKAMLDEWFRKTFALVPAGRR